MFQNARSRCRWSECLTLFVLAKVMPESFRGRPVRELQLKILEHDACVLAVGGDHKEEARANRGERRRIGDVKVFGRSDL